jgi:hypothetical protein
MVSRRLIGNVQSLVWHAGVSASTWTSNPPWRFAAISDFGSGGCTRLRADRALEPVAGLDIMQRRRPAARKPKDLASGPGKLTLALAITRAHNGADITRGALVVRSPAEQRAFHVETTPRIGITKCADWPLRIVIRPER